MPASGSWKKNMYQERLSWAGVVKNRAPSAARCGTDIATSRRNRSGRWTTAP